MISEQSFFRNIPTAINLRQRLAWEAAGWAIQMLSLSHERLKAAVRQIDVTPSLYERPYPTDLATEIFSDCWSIVDQCHMLRKVFERTIPAPSPDGQTQAFINKYEAATLIRNRMDHLHQNIDNIANDKTTRSPLFGTLCFLVANENDIVKDPATGAAALRSARVVSLTAGALTHPEHGFQVVPEPSQIAVELPVGRLEFEAFQLRLNISEMMMDLAALVHRYDTVAKPKRDEQLRKAAREKGLDEEKIIKESLGAFFLVTSVEFVD